MSTLAEYATCGVPCGNSLRPAVTSHWFGKHFRHLSLQGRSAGLQPARSSHDEVRKKLAAVDKQIKRVLTGIRKELQSTENHVLLGVFAALEDDLAALEEQISNSVRNVLKPVSVCKRFLSQGSILGRSRDLLVGLKRRSLAIQRCLYPGVCKQRAGVRKISGGRRKYSKSL